MRPSVVVPAKNAASNANVGGTGKPSIVRDSASELPSALLVGRSYVFDSVRKTMEAPKVVSLPMCKTRKLHIAMDCARSPMRKFKGAEASPPAATSLTKTPRSSSTSRKSASGSALRQYDPGTLVFQSQRFWQGLGHAITNRA